MDDKRIAEIRIRAEAATDGPWEAVPECPDSIAANVTRTSILSGQKLSATWVAAVDMENRHDYTDELESESAENDRHFIAHSRQDIPDLLDALEAARKENAELRAALEEACCDRAIELRNSDDGGAVVCQWLRKKAAHRTPHLAAWLRQQEVQG